MHHLHFCPQLYSLKMRVFPAGRDAIGYGSALDGDSIVSKGYRPAALVHVSLRAHMLLDKVQRPMAELTEIRIEGRGGQGNMVAAYTLARSAFEAGRFAQAYPTFGPERRGAPVSAFVRISDGPIRRRCQVRKPDFIIIQDPSLLHVPGIGEGIRPDGGILINSSKEVARSRFPGVAHVTTIAATSMAMQFVGQPIPNIALLAAFLTLTELIPLEALEKVLAHRFQGAALKKNLQLMREAAAQVTPASWKETSHAAAD